MVLVIFEVAKIRKITAHGIYIEYRTPKNKKQEIWSRLDFLFEIGYFIPWYTNIKTTILEFLIFLQIFAWISY